MPPTGRRLTQLLVGLALFSVSLVMLIRSELGLDPWDVFHQGIAKSIGADLGIVVIFTSVAVLLLWVPLRQRPGLGTLMNAVLVGLVFELIEPLFPHVDGVLASTMYLVVGILLNAVATGLYIGAGLGPGPRDGLMTGLAARGVTIRRVRTAIEVIVLSIGWMLGGTVGIGTVAFAVSIGPLVQILLPRLTIVEHRSTHVATERILQ